MLTVLCSFAENEVSRKPPPSLSTQNRVTSPVNVSPQTKHRALTSRELRPNHVIAPSHSQIPRATGTSSAVTSRQTLHHLAIAQQVAQQQRMRHQQQQQRSTPSPPTLPSWITHRERAAIDMTTLLTQNSS